MKKVFLLISVALGIILFVSFSSQLPNTKKDYINFRVNLYACRYEVRNIEYSEFLNDLKVTNQNEKYLKCVVDSAQWTKKMKLSFYEPFVALYHRDPAYSNYPVVNITLEAANLYCAWLTDKYNSSEKKKFKKVIFRLPSEKEWEALASPLLGHNLPWYGNFLYTDAEGKIPLANVKVKNINGINYDGGLAPMVVGHYKPNNLDICDVIGNVAEMTKDSLIKGGSWDNYLNECTIDKTQNYTPPDPRVGFRVIMEVIEK